MSPWGPCGLEGGIRITYCTGSWPCVCPCERVFFLFCFVLLWGGGLVGGSRGVLITASYQVTCKCVIGPNFLMCISAPRSGRECWQGKRLCHCFSVNTQWVNFSRENALIALFSVVVFFFFISFMGLRRPSSLCRLFETVLRRMHHCRLSH